MSMTRILLAASLCIGPVFPAFADTSDFDKPKVQTGLASYYALSRNNLRTTSGEKVNPKAYTAAHWTLPLGSWVKVTNLSNGRSVKVRINDRSAPNQERIIDLSRQAAKYIGMIQAGIAEVKWEPTTPPPVKVAGAKKP